MPQQDAVLVAAAGSRRARDLARRLLKNGVRPHSALANRTPEEFRAQYIAVAASRSDGQNFNLRLYS